MVVRWVMHSSALTDRSSIQYSMGVCSSALDCLQSMLPGTTEDQLTGLQGSASQHQRAHGTSGTSRWRHAPSSSARIVPVNRDLSTDDVSNERLNSFVSLKKPDITEILITTTTSLAAPSTTPATTATSANQPSTLSSSSSVHQSSTPSLPHCFKSSLSKQTSLIKTSPTTSSQTNKTATNATSTSTTQGNLSLFGSIRRKNLLSVSRHAGINSSTGSSTSGFSSFGSKSDCTRNIRFLDSSYEEPAQESEVAPKIFETADRKEVNDINDNNDEANYNDDDLDEDDDEDDSDENSQHLDRTLSIYRSSSFKLAIEQNKRVSERSKTNKQTDTSDEFEKNICHHCKRKYKKYEDDDCELIDCSTSPFKRNASDPYLVDRVDRRHQHHHPSSYNYSDNIPRYQNFYFDNENLKSRKREQQQLQHHRDLNQHQIHQQHQTLQHQKHQKRPQQHHQHQHQQHQHQQQQQQQQQHLQQLQQQTQSQRQQQESQQLDCPATIRSRHLSTLTEEDHINGNCMHSRTYKPTSNKHRTKHKAMSEDTYQKFSNIYVESPLQDINITDDNNDDNNNNNKDDNTSNNNHNSDNICRSLRPCSDRQDNTSTFLEGHQHPASVLRSPTPITIQTASDISKSAHHGHHHQCDDDDNNRFNNSSNRNEQNILQTARSNNAQFGRSFSNDPHEQHHHQYLQQHSTQPQKPLQQHQQQLLLQHQQPQLPQHHPPQHRHSYNDEYNNNSGNKTSQVGLARRISLIEKRQQNNNVLPPSALDDEIADTFDDEHPYKRDEDDDDADNDVSIRQPDFIDIQTTDISPNILNTYQPPSNITNPETDPIPFHDPTSLAIDPNTTSLTTTLASTTTFPATTVGTATAAATIDDNPLTQAPQEAREDNPSPLDTNINKSPSFLDMDFSNLSLKETQEKFDALSLSLKTDQLTVTKRFECHFRAREVSEQNIQREMDGIKCVIKDMSVRTMEDQPALHELIKMQQHVNVLERSINRLSSKAEIYGAVHQELRMNHAMNLMLKHVENLKEHFEKDRSDLEIARKALIDNNLNDVLSHDIPGPSSLRTGPRFRESHQHNPQHKQHHRNQHTHSHYDQQHYQHHQQQHQQQANNKINLQDPKLSVFVKRLQSNKQYHY